MIAEPLAKPRRVELAADETEQVDAARPGRLTGPLEHRGLVLVNEVSQENADTTTTELRVSPQWPLSSYCRTGVA